MQKILKETFEIEGETYIAECCAISYIPKEYVFEQVQAVCFTHEENLVMYEHVEGWMGLPGGYSEEQESLEITLNRELLENVGVQLEYWEVLGYEIVYPEQKPEKAAYFLRVIAQVTLLDNRYPDPDQKSLGRVVMSYDQAQSKIGYGERGKYWLHEAHERFKQTKEFAGVIVSNDTKSR